MYLDVLPVSNDTARLVRVYGDEPCITLPAQVPAAEGGVWAVAELGDYCFSEKPRNLPAADALCRYEVNGETVTLTRAFGRDLTGKSRRYDLDFGEGAPEADLHPVCGNFLEEVTLNCFALTDLIVRAAPEETTGLFALVNNITEAVRALFWLPDEDAPRAGLWYPAYWEDVEESPAHILLHTFSGQGYHYRQCFLNGKFLCAEYDAIFPEGHASEDMNIMAMLCFDRLRWPWNLSDAAKTAYREFLTANTGRVITRLLKTQDLDGLKALLALDVLDAAGFAEGAQLAAKADDAAAAALLADAEYAKQAAKPKKKRYDFDF